MSIDGDGDKTKRGDLIFVAVSAAIFLVIAAMVVYFVVKIVL